jgi:hypothetical protein
VLHHITIGPIVKLYEIVLNWQQAQLRRRARAIAGSLGSAATLYKVRVRLRWTLERWAAYRLDGANVEGDCCVIWVNTVPAELQAMIMIRALNTRQGWH